MKKILVLSAVAAVATTGCSVLKTSDDIVLKPEEHFALKSLVADQDRQIADLQSLLLNKNKELITKDQELIDAIEEAKRNPATAGSLLPPARPGECFARAFIVPKYKNEKVRVLKTGATEKVSIVPAKYGYETKQVMSQAETKVVEVIPAKYGYKTEKVLVTPAIKKLKTIPAVYKTEVEEIVVKPATTEWKRGRSHAKSAISSRVDSATGEVMCLVRVPAVTKKITRKVEVKAATTESVVVKPAQYKNVRTRILLEEPRTVTRVIPAKYNTVKVKKVVTPERSVTTKVPATYTYVNKKVKVADGFIKWTPVLCDVNATPALVSELQRALKAKGLYRGPIDGIVGVLTVQAAKQFQKKQGLAIGGITIETVKALGLNP